MLRVRTLVGACGAVLLAISAVPSAEAQIATDCELYARQQADSFAPRRGLIGGVVGTALDIATLGGAYSARWHAAYDRAFNDCMAGSSVVVIERPAIARGLAVAAAPAPWTPEWYSYCAAKYRSFDPATGMFLSYSGEYRLCR